MILWLTAACTTTSTPPLQPAPTVTASQAPTAEATNSLIVTSDSHLFLGGYLNGRWTASNNYTTFNNQTTFDFYQNGTHIQSLTSTGRGTSVTCEAQFINFDTANDMRGNCKISSSNLASTPKRPNSPTLSIIK